ncbi:MAG TPA: DnaJ domain-containing protein, partial [Thalassobaculum sp.]
AGALLLPFAIRWGGVARAIRNAAKAARGPTRGQSSGVRTRYLAMQLDHDTGALDGEVLEGRLAGRRLSSLDGDERRELLAQVADDPASLQVLQAWIERAGAETGAGTGPGAGADGGPSGGPGAGAADDGTMTRARALEILGVSDDATEEEIREAHRRLMMANHPDRGGSSWLAAQINRAKDVLLGRR